MTGPKLLLALILILLAALLLVNLLGCDPVRAQDCGEPVAQDSAYGDAPGEPFEHTCKEGE